MAQHLTAAQAVPPAEQTASPSLAVKLGEFLFVASGVPGTAGKIVERVAAPAPDAVQAKLVTRQAQEARIQAHNDFLTKTQRDSGIRIRLCATGTYSIYNDAGHFVARSAPVTTGHAAPLFDVRTAAARMAYSEELAAVCRAADLDYESTGTVSPETVNIIRTILRLVAAA